MIRLFNNSDSTFLLTADDGTQKFIPFKAFSEVDDKYTNDITYRMAMAAGAFTVFDTAKQGDAVEKKAHGKNRGKNQPADDDFKESFSYSSDSNVGDDVK